MSSVIPAQAYDQSFYNSVPGLKLPVIPEEPIYTQHELEIFPKYSRDSYRVVTGKDAPAFDPSRPIKQWFVPLPVNSTTFQYLYFDARDAEAPVKIGKMTAAEAISVNLPAKRTFPPYEIAPTPAAIVGKSTTYERPIAAVELSTEEEAKAMAAEFHSSQDPAISFLDGPLFTTDWRGETRRPYYIFAADKWLNVGRLLEMKNRYGIGHPGVWEINDGVPTWISANVPDGTEKDYPLAPSPVRPLLQVEKVQPGAFGAAMILRTDKASSVNPQPAQAVLPPELGDFLLDLKSMMSSLRDQVADLHRVLATISSVSR